MHIYGLHSLKKLINAQKPSKVLVVSSPLLLKKLKWAILEIKKCAGNELQILTIPDGEKAKEWKELEKLLVAFTKNNLDRRSLVLALGGGTVGDVTGFACSIYLRGVPYVQIPTTLLAQVDSSMGGKTGINFSGYKNQIGSFYNPLAICIDHRFIKHLTEDQVTDGLAEIIKKGLIKDPSILTLLKKHGRKVFKNRSLLKSLLQKSITVKEFYIKKDPRDMGIRQILNFGHTIGHAIELNYHLHHGHAVLIGMLQELSLGEKLGKTNPSVKIYLQKVLKKLRIVVNENEYKADRKVLVHDKKIAGDSIMLPVVKEVGESKLVKVFVNKIA